MSTLPTEYSGPVKVSQVFADFGHGMPSGGTVYVGTERHRVKVFRTIGGLMGRCACPRWCAAIPEAIRAFEIMAEALARSPRRHAQAGLELDRSSDPVLDPQPSERRPYDGLARATCEADLISMEVPGWAYDERGIRRPILEAEIAQAVWDELHGAFDRLLGDRHRTEPSDGGPVFRYYRASWEPDRGMSYAEFKADRQAGFDEEGQPEGSVA